MPPPDIVVESQLQALDDTDCYASVWEEILTKQRNHELSAEPSSLSSYLWGGRGKGGRGLARRTVQPRDIVVDDIRLQYLLGDICLEGATLKLLQNKVYALIGKNGCGKSTLLQRIHAQKIPGWSTQWSTLYLPSELPSIYLSKNPVEAVIKYHEDVYNRSNAATQSRIDELEQKLDALDVENDQEEVEQVCEKISHLEEQLQTDISSVEKQAKEALLELGIDDMTSPCSDLSQGQQKRVLLSVALLCTFTNLLLLDEPTNNLDVLGLIQLRRLIESSSATVVLVSHDVDLINDVATDIIDMHSRGLWYYPGNYDSYRLMKDQREMHELRQSAVLEKKRGTLLGTLQHLKEQPVGKRGGGAKKKAKAIASQRKKLEWHEVQEKEASSTSALPQTKGLTAAQRLKLAETMKEVPHKGVQFLFPKTNSTWGEPLVTLLEVGHGFDHEAMEAEIHETPEEDGIFTISRKPGYLFDCVDYCVEEGSRNCILGPTSSGKSTLLKILAKRLNPLEGSVHHASGVSVGYFDAEVVNDIAAAAVSSETTALGYFKANHPKKTDQDIRAHLTGFGLSPTTQSKTPICYLSGGEKCRFVLATVMMDNPPLLCLDDPTSHLDVESVQALIYGLRHWNGTLIMVSQDANFLRSIENVKCSVIMPNEGKLRRVEGGMDAYLKSFQF